MQPPQTGHLSISLDGVDVATHTGGWLEAGHVEAPATISIEYARWSADGSAASGDRGSGASGDADAPVVVMLHEGLGSVAQWRDVPGRVHDATGLDVFAFNRWGYGTSTTAAHGFGPRFMHTEGLALLSRVLTAAGIERPILVGHSDGGSISLIAAGSGSVKALGVMVIAPHIYVEAECAAGIESIEAQRDRIVEGLSRYHQDPAATFAAWNDVWLHPEFQSWDIRGYLPTIECPVFAIQGADDEYATDAMVTGIAEAVPDSRGAVLVPDCGHIAHRDQPDVITSHIVDFVTSLA